MFKNEKRLFYIVSLFFLIVSFSAKAQTFISVKDGRFVKDTVSYHYMGTNFWYGMNLAAADKPRLLRELDRLQQLGITNLRIMAATEGNTTAPQAVQPAVQTSPGVYNEELLKGLDFLLAEMGKRSLTAVLCLGNFWQWSGGFAQYVSWAHGNQLIPFPAGGNSWDAYQRYTARFYNDKKALQYYYAYITMLLNRTNTVTNTPYRQDTAIMAWELANEPRGYDNAEAYRDWIAESARYIKSLDSNHLVTTGSEGNTPDAVNGNNFSQDHSSPDIDYCTFHIWPQNWGWYRAEEGGNYYAYTMGSTETYINGHVAVAVQLHKPIVLEEFGLPRDEGSYSPKARTKIRDKYYAYVFTKMYIMAAKTPQVGGVNFWAWAGEGRPREPKAAWQPGDSFTGDPPHEPQGWYSVYNKDRTTLNIIEVFAEKFTKLP